MAEITAKLVNCVMAASVMDAKKALVEVEGDIEKQSIAYKEKELKQLS